MIVNKKVGKIMKQQKKQENGKNEASNKWRKVLNSGISNL